MSSGFGRLRIGARETAWLVLAAGYLAMLREGLPGHLSIDSVTALYQGRLHLRVGFGPAFFAWLLGVLDGMWTGTALYVILSAAGLFLSLAWLPRVR